MRPRITFANVVSVIALFVALGGTAIATHPGGQNTISTADIINGEVKVADVGQGAVATDELANGQVKAADIGDGEVKAAEIANGQVGSAELGAGAVRSGNVADNNLTGGDIAGNSLKGADIHEATLDVGDAARAYAYVTAGTCDLGPCTIEAAKGISRVDRVATGFYCVTAPGIDQATTSAAVTVDFRRTGFPEGNASAMTDPAACGDNRFGVNTQRQPITGDGTTVGPADVSNNVSFTIVIP